MTGPFARKSVGCAHQARRWLAPTTALLAASLLFGEAGCSEDDASAPHSTGANSPGGGSTVGGGLPGGAGGGGQGSAAGGAAAGGMGGGGAGGDGDGFVSLGDGVWVSPAHPAPGDPIVLRYAGELASAATVTAHYGFDGWNETTDPLAVEADDGTGNLDFFAEQAMAPVPNTDRHELELWPPAGASALHVVFRASPGGSEQWDNAEGHDYNFGLSFPYVGPVLSWAAGASPATELDVHFHSGYRCVGVVEYGTGGDYSHSATDGTAGLLHHITLPNLSPATSYDYRVRCEGGEPSPSYSFETAAAVSSSLEFAVLSDAQDDGEDGRWGEVASALATGHDEVAFLLFVGDLPWNDKPGLWWTFFDRGRELFARRPLVAVPGNHDTPTVGTNSDTSRLRSWFGLASPSDTSRALRWGPAALLLLDSERPGDFALTTGAQFELASQTIASWASDPPAWAFAAYHVPSYNAGARHWADQGTFRDVTSLFDGSIDWVFGGHEHLAQRTKPLRYNGQLAPSGNYGRGSSDGVGYLVLPPAGAWPETGLIAWDDPKAYYRDRLAFPAPAAQQNSVASEIGYTIVRLAGESITIELWGLGDYSSPHEPVLRDSVSYTRP